MIMVYYLKHYNNFKQAVLFEIEIHFQERQAAGQLQDYMRKLRKKIKL